MGKKQFIQLWRLTACAMVFLVHFGQRIYFVGPLLTISDFGAKGVSLFFIISGFLLVNSYEKKADLKTFIYGRLLKILPLYYVVIAYYFVVHTFLLQNVPEDPTGFGWIRYLFCLNGILPDADMYFWDNLGITWTIPYFVFAYLMFPIVLKYVNSYGKSILLLLGTLLLSANMHWFGEWMKILAKMPAFALGVVLYFCVKEKREMCTSIFLCLLILYQLVFWRVTGMIYCYIFALMIIATENISFTNPKILKILEWSDNYSYTLYLCHGIVFIHILDRVEIGRVPEAVIAVVGSTVLTIAVNRWVEVPLRNKILQWSAPQQN